MKLIHLSTRDAGGGAAIAASRMHAAFLRAGYDSELWVAHKSGHLPATRVVGQGLLTGLRRARALRRETALRKMHKDCSTEMISLNLAADSVVAKVAKAQPDVVLVHWTGNSFIQPESLAQLSCPVIQVLHDMWPITGVEHYTEDFVGVERGVPSPNDTSTPAFRELSRKMMLRKRAAYGRIGKLGFWANSKWLAEVGGTAFVGNRSPSSHFYFPIDTQAFRLFSREQARDILGLPREANLVLAGADSLDNPRKGADCLVSALKHSASCGSAFECVCLGNGGQVFAEHAGIPVHRMGYLSDPLSLSLVYSAVDVTAAPSRQEAFGQVCQESMVCGTPVVAFDTGGHREQITHREMGYLARCYEAADLAGGLVWALKAREDDGLRGRIRESACHQAAPDEFLKQFETLLEQIS